MTRLHRPHISWSILYAAIIKNGGRIPDSDVPGRYFTLEEAQNGDIQLDHDPSLGRRPFDPETKEYDPPANDIRYMRFRHKQRHEKKTNGPGGTKRITTAGSDRHAVDHGRRLKEAHSAHQQAMANKCGSVRKKSGTIPSRGFQKRKST